MDNDPDGYEILGENPDAPRTRYGSDAIRLLVFVVLALLAGLGVVALAAHWLLTTVFSLLALGFGR